MKIGISACLIGDMCTYKGSSNLIEELRSLDVEWVKICPEVMGGLSIPRDPAEIISTDPLKVVSVKGNDETDQYVQGSHKALALLLKEDVHCVLTKNNSPSCGSNTIYDGTFSHTVIEGNGVFVSLAKEKGLTIFTEKQLDEFYTYIKEHRYE